MMGKYAEMRKNFLENHAPEMYEAMTASGSLTEHLESVQKTAADYVETQVENFKNSPEYKSAESRDFSEAAGLVNMTVLEAEDTAYRIWIAALPGEENNEEDEEILE